jgi:gliding motility-associated-like protein
MKHQYCLLLAVCLCLATNIKLHAQGTTCADPYIITDLPLNALGLSNCGMQNDYGTGGCGGNYMSGEDMVFELTTAQAACYTMLLYGINGNAGANIYVFEGCPAGNNCVGSGDAGGGGGGGGGNDDSYLQIALDAATTYYIVVGSSNVSGNNDCAEFDIFISDPDSAPENDFCQNASQLGGLGSNYNATACDEPDAWTPNEQGFECDGDGGWSGNHNGVWYTFNNPTLQDVTIEVFNIVCDGNVGQSLLQLGVWSNTGTCDLGEEQFYNCLVTVGDAELFLNNLPAGDYYLYCDGSAASLCTWGFASEQVITCNTPEITAISPTTTQICANGSTPVTFSIDTAGTQPMSIVWTQNGSPIAANTLSLTVTPNGSTTYSVAISNDCGSDTEIFEVIANNLPTIAPTVPTTYNICSNNTTAYSLNTTTSGTNPITVTWTQNGIALPNLGNTLSVTPTANTTYIATASNNCGIDTVQFIFNSLPTPTAILSGGGAVCAGSGDAVPMSVNFSGQAPYALTYAINGIAQPALNAISNNPYTFTATQAGTYTLLSVSDANCSGMATGIANLSENPLPQAPLLPDTLRYCQGDTLATIAVNTNGGNVNWYVINPSIDPNAITSSENPLDLNQYISNTPDTTTLWASITQNGCISNPTALTIIVNPIPPQPTAPNIAICEGDTLPNLSAIGENIVWYNAKPGTTNSQIIANGNTLLLNTLIATDTPSTTVFWFDQTQYGCTSLPQSATVTVANMPTIAADNIGICQNDTLPPIVAQSDGNITWYSNALLDQAIGTGDTIWLTQSDTVWAVAANIDNTCTTTPIPVSLTLAVQDNAQFTFDNYLFCIGDENPTPTIIGTQGGLFSANNNLLINAQNGTIDLLSATAGTTYSVNYSTQGICPADTQLQITVQGIELQILPDTSITQGTTLPIWASAQASGGGDINYTWLPANSLSCANCPQPFASPTATTTYTVVASDQNNCSNSQQVTINVEPIPLKALVPTAFSPNNDGVNDSFGIITSQASHITLQVYNRWGERIFETQNGEAWNGKQNNIPAEIGVYAYWATVTFNDGTLQHYQGNVTLVR